jgi:hypothetical protein
MMVAPPAFDGFERPTPGNHGAGRHELVIDLLVRAVQPPLGCLVMAIRDRKNPLMETLSAVAERVVRAFIGTGDKAVERHGHVKHC